LREREALVRREKTQMSSKMHDQRNALARDEAVVTFKSILIDTVRSHFQRYSTALEKSLLQKDTRWALCTVLSMDEKQHLFNSHIDSILEKHFHAFADMLAKFMEMSEIFVAPWAEIWDMFKTDPRVTVIVRDEDGNNVVQNEERMKLWFAKYQKEQIELAIKEYEMGLEENSFIKFHVKSAVQNLESKLAEEAPSADKILPMNAVDVWPGISIPEIKSVLKVSRGHEGCFDIEYVCHTQRTIL
jgi:hypothetical protein